MSNLAKLEQFCENHYAGFRCFSLSTEVAVLSAHDPFVFVTGCVGRWLNAGISGQVEQLPTEELLQQVTTKFVGENVNASWRIASQSKDVPGGVDFWKCHSWAPSGVQQVMHLDLTKKPQLLSAELTFREAVTTGDLNSFYRVFTSAFEGEERDIQFLSRFSEQFVMKEKKVDSVSFVGYLANTPVVCGTMYGSGSYRGIYNIGVVPEMRGRGYAQAMISFILHTAADSQISKLGRISKLGLVDSPSSAGIYPRFGFEPVGWMHSLMLEKS